MAGAKEMERRRSDMVAQHRHIFELITKGDDVGAERAVRDHIMDLYGRLLPAADPGSV